MKQFDQFVIFGGKGFIGSHLNTLLQKRYPTAKIHIADLLVSSETETEHFVDVCRPFEIKGSFGPNTLLFNFAAVHRTPGHEDHEYFETNIYGAQNVCDFAVKNNIENVVFTSSIAPYGASEDEKTEDSLPMPNTPYGISKFVAENIHRTWQAGGVNRKLLILRPGIVFGAGEHGNMTRLFKGLKSHKFAYAGRKDTIKANIYVKDLVQLMLKLTESEEKVQLYNCCTYPAPTIESIVKDMLAATEMKRCVPYIPKSLLMPAAHVAKVLGGLGLGICPERMRKLMVSTNINGKRLSEKYTMKYSLQDAFRDWFEDCNKEGLE